MSALPTIRLLVTAAMIAHAAAMPAQTVDWKQISAGSPSGRCCMGMAYDGATHATVLFGGAAGRRDLRRHLELARQVVRDVSRYLASRAPGPRKGL
jgi:hypothetical protein